MPGTVGRGEFVVQPDRGVGQVGGGGGGGWRGSGPVGERMDPPPPPRLLVAFSLVSLSPPTRRVQKGGQVERWGACVATFPSQVGGRTEADFPGDRSGYPPSRPTMSLAQQTGPGATSRGGNRLGKTTHWRANGSVFEVRKEKVQTQTNRTRGHYGLLLKARREWGL